MMIVLLMMTMMVMLMMMPDSHVAESSVKPGVPNSPNAPIPAVCDVTERFKFSWFIPYFILW